MYEWLECTKKSTYQKYECLIRNHIAVETIGSVQVQFLTRKCISDFAAEKESTFSAKSVNDILVIINLALSYAEEIYNIPKAKIRKIKKYLEENEIKTVTRKETLSTSTIDRMLSNEKNVGDVLMQNGFTDDFLTGKRKKITANWLCILLRIIMRRL